MSYVEKYFCEWQDFDQVTHEIKLLEESGTAGTTRIQGQKTPVTITRRGGKKVQLENNILGSELKFRFYLPIALISAFDAISESEFKVWKLEFYKNSVLEFSGYLRPDNNSRDWIKKGDNYFLTLSATDSLASLKEIEYVDFSTGDQYSDRVSLITTIKRALEHLELELDFRIQLGTYVTNDSLMTSTDCALDKVTCDNGRFTKTKDGREVNEDCYTIIQKILKDFNCYLMQSGGYYWIINAQEVNSYYFPIPWSTLVVGTRTANDLRVDMSSYKYNDYGELQKIRPFEAIEITFRDRNVPDNLLSNGDFSGGTTGWNKSAGLFGSFIATNGYGEQPFVYALDSTTADANYIYTDNESIAVKGTDDKLSLIFDARMVSFIGASGSEPLLKPRVFHGATEIHPNESVYDVIPLYESSAFTRYEMTFPLNSTATDYTIRWTINPRTVGGLYTSFQFEIDNVYFTTIYSDGADITFDKFYKVNNIDSVFTDTYEQELFFGDSFQDNDIGAFKVSGTRSKTWARYGKTEDTSIQTLSAQNLIENFSKYKDYLRIEFFDQPDNIEPYSILLHDSKNFQILSHTTIFGANARKEIKCEVCEVLNSAVNVSISSQTLTSVDGESTTSSVTQSTPGGGGATINDSVTASDSVWSSSKVNTEVTTTPTLDSVTDSGSTTTNGVQVGSVAIGASKWVMQLNGNDLEFSYNGTVMAKLTSAGYFSTADDQEMFDTGL